jgi:hypothetical protein
MVTGYICVLFHIPFPIVLLINFYLYIFPTIKTKDTHNCCYGNVCSYLFFVLKQNYYVIHFLYL